MPRLASRSSSPSLARSLRSLLGPALVALALVAVATPAAAQNRLSIATSVLDAPGGTVLSGADFRYRVSYSCDLVSIPSCDGAEVTVELPPEVEFRSLFFPPGDVASGSHDGSPTGGTVTFTFNASVPAGNTGDLEITVRFPNGSTADGTTTTGLTDAAESTGTGLVTQLADLPPVTALASPQVDLDVDLQGRWIDDCPDPSVYRVTIGPSTDDGSLDFIDVTELVLTLPTGVTNVTPNDGGVYDGVANTVTWSNLGVVSVPSSLTVTVGVTFADPPFSGGQTVTAFGEATVDALGEPPGTMVGPLPFDDTLRVFSENPSASVDKRFADGRPSSLPPAEGQSFTYRVDVRNDGNVDLDSLTVVDDGDGAGADLDGALTIDAVSTGAYDAGYTNTVTISYTTNLGGPFVLGSSPGNVDANFPIPALGAGERVTRITWDFAGPIPVGASPTTRAEVAATVDAGFPAGTTVDNHLTADWTATLTGLCGGAGGPASGSDSDGFDFDVNDAYTYLRSRKDEITTGPYFPGDTVTFGLQLTNDALADDPAVDPVVTDLLPEFLTFQPGSESYSDNGTGVVLAAPGDFEVIPNYNGTGRTLLRWSLTGDLDPGETVEVSFDTVVELGVVFGTLTNQVGSSFPAGPIQQICAGASTTDVADLDGDGDVTDALCTENENVTIAAVAQLASTKFVRGQCDGAFLPGLGTGTSLPGGTVDWWVTVQNVETVPMENFVIVDVLPFVGDTGVRDLTPRLSLFRPLLVAPIDPPPGGAVFYSLSGNPCRPEVGGPTSSCDPPNWTTVPPDPITGVRSIKIEFGDRVLDPLDTLDFGWSMVLPADAPIDGSEAFNSFAFGATRQDDGGFLGAEPNKVGIDATCTPLPPDDAMLGDFVWVDDDGDGVQDAGESGVNDVPVELYQPGPDGIPRTGDDVLLLTSITADDAGGNPGWYKFSALVPGDYYVLFRPPLGFDVTVRDAGGDDALDSDADPASACTDVVTLGPSENNPDVDLGLVPKVTASLGDYVWFDLDGDGVQNEATDRGLNGTTVRLFADDGDGTPEPFGDDGTPLEVTVTGDDDFGNPGFYLFEELIPGVPYFVQFVQPSPATGFTARDAGGDDTVDSDADPGDGTSQVVTLAAGEHDPTLDAGVVLLTGTLGLGNVVWIDDDGNGVIDAPGDDDGVYDPLVPEAGVNGVRVDLYLDVDGDGLPQVDEFVATTETQTLAGKDGRYRFDGLPAGDFIVEIDPSSFASGGALQGFVSTSFDTVDPNDDVDGDDSGHPLGTSVVSPPITLSPGSEPIADADDDLGDDDDLNFTLDFGFVPGPSPAFDYGDDPDAGTGTAQGDYRTVSLDGGPSHPLLGAAGPYLGACVDADDGEQQNAAATDDDLSGAAGPTFGSCATAGDDEDGAVFSATLLTLGGTFDLDLSSSSPTGCLVNGFVDWNRDGDFGDAGEQILTDAAVASGTVSFPGIAVPATAVPGFTYARFRCSSAGGDGPDGPAADGEVEDYRLQLRGADWGDAPEPAYPTLDASGGPSHATDPGVELYLGNCVDTESDGQPAVGADGDDVNLGDSRIGDCVDDEDGVTFDTMFVRGESAQLTVTASAPGRVDAWIDFDGGGFGVADQVLADQPVVAGANPFVVAVPAGAVVGTTWTRFRFSTAGGLAVGGPAVDGEVEDHAVVIKDHDFGDAPDSYGTTDGSNGPRHVVDPATTLYLGGCVDVEGDAQPPLDASGDDVTAGIQTVGSCAGGDDEDGVVFQTPVVACQQATVDVTANAAGALDAWLDFDGDGTFGAGEQLFAGQPLAPGVNSLGFAVPCDAALGATYSRWRLSSAGGLGTGGQAMDGEVEDHPLAIRGVDFGDDPDGFGTTFAAGGPTHGVDPASSLYLGACVDTETDAGTPLDATGDDLTPGTSTVGGCAVAGDDEDGVTFDAPVAACRSADLTVTAGAAGVLDGWLDFDGDGVFGAGERIFTGEPVVAGANALTFPVPCDAVPGQRFSRFRLSSAGVAGPGGPSVDGEVEDYAVTVLGADFGDDPDSYPTTFAAGGPFHTVDPSLGLYLGACVDTESDGQPGVGADGDDVNGGSTTVGSCSGGDDEDGVTFDTLVTACKPATVTVTASAPGLLDGWVDFDLDGGFGEAGDQVFAAQALAAGANTLTFNVPCTATDGETYARFRLSTAGGLPPTGPADDGEVEDYRLSADDSDLGDAPDSYQTLLASGGAVHDFDPAEDLHLGACVDAESDGRPSTGADGDDVNATVVTAGSCTGGDDEDGVVFDSAVNVCLDADLTVTASAPGVLDAWLDLDGDGTFNGPDDRIFAGQPLAAGANPLTFTVPCGASPGDSYARFRFTTGGVATFAGPAANGEVEDYAVRVDGFDFGDAPDPSYPTLLASDGARHVVQLTGNPVLGQEVDIEPEGLQSPDHLGDDQDGVDDEDGVAFLDDDGVLIPGTTTQIEVTGGAVGGLLDAFVDWNRDGDWDDAGEQVAASVPVGAGVTTTLDVPVPVPASAGLSCARFRLSTAGGLSATGMAADGEVEDYQVEIGVEEPIIGLGKQVLEIEKIGFNEWLVSFELTVDNLGNVPLSNVQVEASLADAFAEAEDFFVDSLSSGDLTVNPDFDGTADVFVLAGTDALEVGGSGVVLMDVVVHPGTRSGPYVCSSVATGVSPADQPVEDVSQDGGDSDPDGDGQSNDNDDPTVIDFPLVTIEIPTLGHLGLALLALLLGIAAVRRVRG